MNGLFVLVFIALFLSDRYTVLLEKRIKVLEDKLNHQPKKNTEEL